MTKTIIQSKWKAESYLDAFKRELRWALIKEKESLVSQVNKERLTFSIDQLKFQTCIHLWGGQIQLLFRWLYITKTSKVTSTQNQDINKEKRHLLWQI